MPRPRRFAANPAATTFIDAIDVVYDATIPYDIRFFQSLDRFVQQEPWLTRDKAMIDQLKAIGIEKGKPFAPDTKTEGILNAGMREAHALLEFTYENAFSPYFVGRHWVFPADKQYINEAQSGYAAADAYPVDARGLVFSFAFFTPKGPTGSFYLMDIRDKAGEALDGANAYRLTVPANAPVRQYWSATVYDRVTHTLIRGQKTVSRSSQSPRACRRTPTDRWTSVLVPRLPRAKSRIGCRRAPAETLKSCFASTVPRNRCSTRHGRCRTSSGSLRSDRRTIR